MGIVSRSRCNHVMVAWGTLYYLELVQWDWNHWLVRLPLSISLWACLHVCYFLTPVASGTIPFFSSMWNLLEWSTQLPPCLSAIAAVDVLCVRPQCDAASGISAERLHKALTTFFAKDRCFFFDQDYEASSRDESASAVLQSPQWKNSFLLFLLGTGQLWNVVTKKWKQLWVSNQLSACECC